MEINKFKTIKPEQTKKKKKRDKKMAMGIFDPNVSIQVSILDSNMSLQVSIQREETCCEECLVLGVASGPVKKLVQSIFRSGRRL